ncbi:hypothetical protein [Corynebacterium casei]|uniref:hypothetical protein n=1 Tax=Corynebacterium casei TaxID=160386 RepID=UPI000B2D0F85|nr:hypothetical protein [Corynebacterium casei]
MSLLSTAQVAEITGLSQGTQGISAPLTKGHGMENWAAAVCTARKMSKPGLMSSLKQPHAVESQRRQLDD